MNLDEFMKENAQDGINYHIGSGGSFFFVGDKKEYEQYIDEISDMYRARFRTLEKKRRIKQESAEERMEKFKADFLEAETHMLRLPRKADLQSDQNERATVAERYSIALAGYVATKEEFEKLKRLADGYAKKAMDYTHLRTREIEEIYDRLQKDGVIISVEGAEEGKYWDREEWNADHEEGEKDDEKNAI